MKKSPIGADPELLLLFEEGGMGKDLGEVSDEEKAP